MNEPAFGNESPSPTVDSGDQVLDPGPEVDPAPGAEAGTEAATPESEDAAPESETATPEAAEPTPEAAEAAEPAAAEPAAAAPVEAQPQDAPDEPWLGNLFGWVKAHPVFALFLFCLVFVVPWGLQELQRELARRQVEQVLAGWESVLVAEGLPLAGLPPREVDLPADLDGGQQRMLQVAGATDRARALLAWADLLAGRTPAKLPNDDSELRWLMQGCLVLHQAEHQQGDAWIRELGKALGRVSLARQPLFQLGQTLVEGRTAAALAEAEGITAQGDPLVEATVARVVVDVTARRVEELVDTRPATLDSLVELEHYASRQTEPVRRALGAGSAEPWLTLGGGDVQRAEALLDVFEALGGPEQEPQAWSVAREDVLRVVVARWCIWSQGYADAQALLVRVLALDPQARFPLGGVLRDWRPLLQRAVNDQAELRALAVRLFEVGVVPPVLEDLSSLWVGQTGAGPETPGEALSAALARVVRLEGGGGETAEEATQALEAVAALEGLVAERGDWIADGLREWVACLRGRVALAAGDPAEAETAFASLLATPRATLPAFRLQGWRARSLIAQQRWADAHPHAEQALSTIEALARPPESYDGQDPRQAEALEAAGQPTERGAFDRVRAAALLDVVETSLGTGSLNEPAWDEAQKTVDPLDPRLDLVHARIAEAGGQGPQAVLRAKRALAQNPGPWVERRLRALLERVGE